MKVGTCTLPPPLTTTTTNTNILTKLVESANDTVLGADVVEEGEDGGVLHVQQEAVDVESCVGGVHLHLGEGVLVLQDLALHLVVNLRKR